MAHYQLEDNERRLIHKTQSAEAAEKLKQVNAKSVAIKQNQVAGKVKK